MDRSNSAIEKALTELSNLPVKVLQQLLLDMTEDRDTYVSHWADSSAGKRIQNHIETIIMEKTVFK